MIDLIHLMMQYICLNDNRKHGKFTSQKSLCQPSALGIVGVLLTKVHDSTMQMITSNNNDVTQSVFSAVYGRNRSMNDEPTTLTVDSLIFCFVSLFISMLQFIDKS